MRFSKGVFLAVPAALAIALGALAATGSTAGNHGDGSARRVERLKEKLGLSDDQAKSIQSAFDADGDARREIGSELRQAMADFQKSALNGDGASTLQAKRTALLDAHGKMLDLRAKQLRKVGAILTPDQRTQFASMRGEGHGRGRWHHHPPSTNDGGTPDDSPAAD